MNRSWAIRLLAAFAVTAASIVASFPLAAQTESVTAGTALPVPRTVKARPLELGLVQPQPTAESGQRTLAQTLIEVEHRGWQLTEAFARDTPTQRNGLQTLIEKNVDAILLVYPVMEPLRDLILEARKKGIGVYCVDTELRPGVIVTSTMQNGVVGAMMAYYVIERLAGTGGVAVLNLPGHILRQRCYAARGLFDSKADWPNLQLLAWEDLPIPGWEKAAYDAAAAWAAKYGGKLKAIFAGWDAAGIFASRALEAAGFSQADIFVCGVDGGSEAYDMIRRGSPFVATMSQPFELYVHNVLEIIAEAQIAGISPGAKGSSVPANRTIYTSPVLTTAENLPPVGAVIHEVFRGSYYDPARKDAWYFWGAPYKVSTKVK